MWITNGTENKKIKKDSIIPEGWRKGRKRFNARVAESEYALNNKYRAS